MQVTGVVEMAMRRGLGGELEMEASLGPAKRTVCMEAFTDMGEVGGNKQIKKKIPAKLYGFQECTSVTSQSHCQLLSIRAQTQR